MQALFIELPAFARYRSQYLDDEGFLALQQRPLEHPAQGDVIMGTGGLRIIYYWWQGGRQFWLFTLYDKDESDDLSAHERAILKQLLHAELEKRHDRTKTLSF